ncbi:OprD family outer membrane porin [Sulfurimonas microaerophilic]|uniref:OprD family outer membrane porin n=1 Tax=Sulfurimonas microaerophilic TaxID=3058392 RepID=UPI0027148BC9|nr:OprD family outer membrane porin [Sulfurimonas sp. hsl 1-7]
MNKKLLGSLLVAGSLLSANEVNSVEKMFTEGKVNANVKYYYIQTDKDFASAPSTSANANSLGGKLTYETAQLKGFSAKATFMTTNAFGLDGSVDTSILGKDNGVYYNDPNRADDSFSVLGEAYIKYTYDNLAFTFGREVMHSPLIDAKEVRMLPSAVEGAFIDYKLNNEIALGFSYLDKFKQRTSDRFTNIVEHALGADTMAVTGSDNGNVYMLDGIYKTDALEVRAYEYYAPDFMNSIYVDAKITHKFDNVATTLAAQYINQMSVGNADDYFAANPTYADGKINVNAFAIKATAKIDESAFTLAYSNVLRDEGSHDSLVLPWDGTPLFTNMITSNDLFQSIYGSALKADSVYIGGSQGIKMAYAQGFDFTGYKGFSTTFSFLNTTNSRAGFDKDQRDYNVVLGYKYDTHFSLALKGIWVDNNTGADKDGSVTQIKQLTQYRVIANYQF